MGRGCCFPGLDPLVNREGLLRLRGLVVLALQTVSHVVEVLQDLDGLFLMMVKTSCIAALFLISEARRWWSATSFWACATLL